MSPPEPRVHRAFAEALRGAWRRQARAEQVAPGGDWTTWVFCGGRGSGKTRSGSEWVMERVAAGARFIHLIAPTAADCRDVLLEGPAGILSIAASHLRPIYQPSLRKVIWPNGAQALLFSSDEPDRLRGPQADTLWIDELCAMRQAQEVLDNAYFGLRVGKNPRALITTTPRPIKPFKALLARDGQDVRVTRSTSYANRDNLAPSFFASIVGKYAGTRIGRQELEAELLTDTPGALWHSERIEELRVRRAPEPFERVVVAIDPAVTFGPDADETGIIVVGLGSDGCGYVLDDLSGRYPPSEWAQRAIQAYRMYSADRIVAEINNGGALVEHTLRSVDPGIPFTAVHASRGKLTRAEPVSALYEQGRVHHVGVFGPLEDQLTSYDGSRSGGSPDRLDALVWGLTALMLEQPPGRFLRTDALLTPSDSGSLEPVALPTAMAEAFAVAAVTKDEPGAIGVVYVALSTSTVSHPAVVVIVDWELIELSPTALHSLYFGCAARLKELQAGMGLESARSALVVDPADSGALIVQEGAVRGHDVRAFESEELLKLPLAQRAIEFGVHLGAGRIKIARGAHGKITEFRGSRRNHFLAHLAAFGLDADHASVAPLLAAAATGALDALRTDRWADTWRRLGAATLLPTDARPNPPTLTPAPQLPPDVAADPEVLRAARSFGYGSVGSVEGAAILRRAQQLVAARRANEERVEAENARVRDAARFRASREPLEEHGQ